MRTLLTSAFSVAALAVPAPPPALAYAEVVLNCTLHYEEMGAAETRGSGTCTITGATDGQVLVGSPAILRFTVRPWLLPCPLSDTLSGTMTGALDTAFQWQRIGPQAVVTAPDGGVGTAEFVTTAPAGNPCGALWATHSVVLTLSIAGPR